MKKNWIRQNIGLVILAVIGAVFLYAMLTPFQEELETVGFDRVMQEIRAENVQEIEISDNKLIVTLNDETQWQSRVGANTDLLQVLSQQEVDLGDVPVTYAPEQMGGAWREILMALIPTILIIGFILFMMRQASNSSSGGAFSFGRSKAKLFQKEGGEEDDNDKDKDKKNKKKRTTFEDVAGLDEAKEELKEVVDFLKSPKKFTDLGARIPKGVLLIGPPGTGKTLLARAVAGEAGAPFYSISGSEFVEMFVGVGASRVRDLFEQAKKSAPCIVFVDELDAVGRHRGAGVGGGHDEREQTLNQILVEMDGFDPNMSVIVMAATNRPDVLDPALLRPGRFDRQVLVDRADVRGREAILNIHSRGKPFSNEVDLAVVARQTAGFSGADLENLMNEAAILTARREKKKIGQREIEEAIDRVLAGPERRSRVITPEQKRLTAYHEAGHALVGKRLPNADAVHKISIVARGMAAGYTRFLPEEDRYNWRRAQFEDMIATLLSGHAAEMMVFGDVTTGASDDLKRATGIARKMVTAYGMSPQMGPQTYGTQKSEVFLGKEMMDQRDYSDDVAREIDGEVRRIIAEAYQKAQDVLQKDRALLDLIAETLIKQETLSSEEFEAFFTDGKKGSKSDKETMDKRDEEAEKETKPKKARRKSVKKGDTE